MANGIERQRADGTSVFSQQFAFTLPNDLEPSSFYQLEISNYHGTAASWYYITVDG